MKNRVLAPVLVSAAERFGFDYSLKSPDRLFLEQDIFSKLLVDDRYRRILFAGVEIYTCHYPRFFPGKAFHTIDWDADKAHYGSRGHHRVGSVCDLDQAYTRASFDAVIFNGLVGYGLNGRADVDRACVAAHHVLVPNGLFILGWNNTERHLNFKLEELPGYRLFRPFTPTLLGMTCSRCPVGTDNHHTFDFLRKDPEASDG